MPSRTLATDSDPLVSDLMRTARRVGTSTWELVIRLGLVPDDPAVGAVEQLAEADADDLA